MVGSNFSSWYNQSEGTFVTKLDTLNALAFYLTVDRGLGSFGPRLQISSPSSTTASAFFVVDDVGSVVCSLAQSGNNSASAYKVNDFALSANGQVPITDTVGALPSGLAALQIGKAPVASNYLNGHIQSIKYYPTRLPNGTLQGLTR
jgi:hypothetical protein